MNNKIILMDYLPLFSCRPRTAVFLFQILDCNYFHFIIWLLRLHVPCTAWMPSHLRDGSTPLKPDVFCSSDDSQKGKAYLIFPETSGCISILVGWCFSFFRSSSESVEGRTALGYSYILYNRDHARCSSFSPVPRPTNQNCPDYIFQEWFYHNTGTNVTNIQ